MLRNLRRRKYFEAWLLAICATAPACSMAPGLMAGENPNTATPIKHIVIIFQENVSFDHYFATYPQAANLPGEPVFIPSADTPSVNGLTPALIDSNPNSTKPFRLDRAQAITCSQNHAYTAEQAAANGGLMDRFVEHAGATAPGCDPRQVMGFFDGNTVTALWNYAQHYVLGDNHFGTTFGPSTPGALNLVSGQTAGANADNVVAASHQSVFEVIGGTVIGDVEPQYDDCSSREIVGMTGRNIGNRLNEKGVSWGFFQGGFRPTSWKDGKAVCAASHSRRPGKPKPDYIPHHEPFQYFPSTANPHHLPPSSVAMIGREGDRAGHQYDLIDFWTAAEAHVLPSVSFLKAPSYQDGHAGYSDPLSEQTFLVETINRLQRLPEWGRMAVIIAYDDSDGWYDHVMPPIVNQSNMNADALTGPGRCGHATPGAFQGRCGYGPRLPILVISPYAKRNYVDSTLTDQSSILRFIEDNWGLERIGNQSFDAKAGSILNSFDFQTAPRNDHLYLDPATGQIAGAGAF